jgi:hypothetical protein
MNEDGGVRVSGSQTCGAGSPRRAMQPLHEFGKTSVAVCAVALGPAGFLQRSQEALRLVVLRYHVVPMYVGGIVARSRLGLCYYDELRSEWGTLLDGSACLRLSLSPCLAFALWICFGCSSFVF